jgi:hypothetical protein
LHVNERSFELHELKENFEKKTALTRYNRAARGSTRVVPRLP